MLKRIPITVAPALGGFLIAARGLTTGIRALLMVTTALAVLTLMACAFISIPRIPDPARTRIAGIWKALPRQLRRLLLSDVFIRTCEGMIDVFLVLYATNVIGIRAPQFGILVAVQALTALAAQIPAGRFADSVGRKPFVVATFVFFALFPIAVVLSRSFTALIAGLHGWRVARGWRAGPEGDDRRHGSTRPPGQIDRPVLSGEERRYQPGGVRRRPFVECHSSVSVRTGWRHRHGRDGSLCRYR
jgi:hypothetical protein